MTNGIDLVARADPDRGRRAAGDHPGAGDDSWRGHRVPDQRRGPGPRTSLRRPACSTCSSLPAGPFTRVDTGLVCRQAGHPATTTRCWPRSSCGRPDRPQALARMDRALAEFRVEGRGVTTTVRFARSVLAHPVFRAGPRMTRDFVDDLMSTDPRSHAPPSDDRTTASHHARESGPWPPGVLHRRPDAIAGHQGGPAGGRNAQRPRRPPSPTSGSTRWPSSHCRRAARTGTASSCPTTGRRLHDFSEILAASTTGCGRRRVPHEHRPGTRDNSIFIDADIDLVWDVTNDVEAGRSCSPSTRRAEILERDGRHRPVPAHHAPRRERQGLELGLRAHLTRPAPVRARRVEPGPFEFMNIEWTYAPEGTAAPGCAGCRTSGCARTAPSTPRP